MQNYLNSYLVNINKLKKLHIYYSDAPDRI